MKECAATRVVNLAVEFSPALGEGTFELTLDTDEGSGTCEGTVTSDGDVVSDSCTGDLDFELSANGFGVFGTPTEVDVHLVHVESGSAFDDTLNPVYAERDPETAEDCPSPFDEIVVEPDGIPVGLAL